MGKFKHTYQIWPKSCVPIEVGVDTCTMYANCWTLSKEILYSSSYSIFIFAVKSLIHNNAKCFSFFEILSVMEVLCFHLNFLELRWHNCEDLLFLGGRGTHLYMSLFFVCPSICPAPYLRNHTSSDHNFWYTSAKWWYLQAVFSFFYFFLLWFFGLLGGVKGQK